MENEGECESLKLYILMSTMFYQPELTLMTPLVEKKVWKCNLVMFREENKIKVD